MLGLIGKKLGMTQIFDASGAHRGVTVIEIEPNLVVGERSKQKDGYSAVILGWGAVRKSRLKKPYAGQFPQGLAPTKVLKEVRSYDRECKPGDKIGLEALEGVLFVDVQGVSKGKGFQGVMRRHGFSGGNKTHGALGHRGLGSTGQAHVKTLPGRKMPGRMGGVSKTVQSLRVIKIDREKGVLLVQGAVPGRPGAVLFVAKAKKK